MPVLQLTPERVDRHHRQLGTRDPSSQYFLLHKPSQCSFPPAMFLSYQTHMFISNKNPYLKKKKISNIHHQWINPSKKMLVTSCYKKQRTLYLISVLLRYRVLCFEYILLISLIKQLLLEFCNHF